MNEKNPLLKAVFVERQVLDLEDDTGLPVDRDERTGVTRCQVRRASVGKEASEPNNSVKRTKFCLITKAHCQVIFGPIKDKKKINCTSAPQTWMRTVSSSC